MLVGDKSGCVIKKIDKNQTEVQLLVGEDALATFLGDATFVKRFMHKVQYFKEPKKEYWRE